MSTRNSSAILYMSNWSRRAIPRSPYMVGKNKMTEPRRSRISRTVSLRSSSRRRSRDGRDVPAISCVVNYSCPNHLEDYVHRVGRTGRAGRKGTAYTFSTHRRRTRTLLFSKKPDPSEAPSPARIRSTSEEVRRQDQNRGKKMGALRPRGAVLNLMRMNLMMRNSAPRRSGSSWSRRWGCGRRVASR